jgi:hypothetical protein
MSNQGWFVAADERSSGPFSDEQFHDMLNSGLITPNTLVWSEGMKAWQKAKDVPGLIPDSLCPPPLPAGFAPKENCKYFKFSADIPTWPLFGRILLIAISAALVIPLPWTLTSFYRWIVPKIKFPTRVTFTGKAADIWYVLMLNAACGYAGIIHSLLPILLLPLTTLFTLQITHWVVANLHRENRTTRLAFSGSYWEMLGWTILLWISLVTIIGWAWVGTAWARWMCRNVDGLGKQANFEASGWSLLWRTFALVLTVILIIPAPWSIGWYARWIVSQFCIGEPQISVTLLQYPSTITKLSSLPVNPAKVGIGALVIFTAVAGYLLIAAKQSPLDCMSDMDPSASGIMWGRVSCAVRAENLTISKVTLNRGICKPALFGLNYNEPYQKGQVITVNGLCTILELSIDSNKGTWTWNFE